MEPTTIGITSHRSWVFYVVADVGLPGTNGSHRPLAVTYRQGHGPGPCRNGSRSEQRVLHVVEDCARIIDILTDPANRVALEAELAAAIWYYRGPHYSEPDRVDIPDAPQPGFDFSPWRDNWVQKPASPERPELPWPGGTREFPFVSSCLRLALHRDDAYGTRLGDVQEQSLATAFRGDQLEYGMVVVDISDLDSISYGIIDSKVSYVVDIDLSINMGWDAVESPRPDREPVIQLEESRPRLPLSGTRYMKKYGLYHPTAAMVRLRKKPVVKPTALHCQSTPSHMFSESLVQTTSRYLATTQSKIRQRSRSGTYQLGASHRPRCCPGSGGYSYDSRRYQIRQTGYRDSSRIHQPSELPDSSTYPAPR